MKNQYAKLFRCNTNNNKSQIVKFSYSPAKDDYYSFVKEHCDKGFYQIIIDSETMIQVVKSYFFTRNFCISNVELMVEDEALSQEIKSTLNKLYLDRAYFGQLIDNLRFLINDSSIDIKKIELRGNSTNSQPLSIIVQVNGIFGISEQHFEEESCQLIDEITRSLQL